MTLQRCPNFPRSFLTEFRKFKTKLDALKSLITGDYQPPGFSSRGSARRFKYHTIIYCREGSSYTVHVRHGTDPVPRISSRYQQKTLDWISENKKNTLFCVTNGKGWLWKRNFFLEMENFICKEAFLGLIYFLLLYEGSSRSFHT